MNNIIIESIHYFYSIEEIKIKDLELIDNNTQLFLNKKTNLKLYRHTMAIVHKSVFFWAWFLNIKSKFKNKSVQLLYHAATMTDHYIDQSNNMNQTNDIIDNIEIPAVFSQIYVKRLLMTPYIECTNPLLVKILFMITTLLTKANAYVFE